jgi:hypothetical protein
MRRIVVFLVVFGAGLALLLHFVREQRAAKLQRAEEGQSQLTTSEAPANPFLQGGGEEEPSAPQPPAGQEEPPAAEEGDGGPRVELEFRGRVRGWVPDAEGRRLYEFDLTDVQPQAGGEYQVAAPELRMLDVTDGSLDTRVRSREASMRIRSDRGGAAIATGEPVRLVEADVRLLRGGPLAPVTIELPEATYDLDRRRLESETNVRVLGDGLFGTGNGLVASREEERIELLRDGLLRLRADEGTLVELRAGGEGSIALRRAGSRAGAERVEVRLADGGELLARGEREVTVRGDSIALDGRVVDTGEEAEREDGSPRPRRAFVPEYAKVTGGVTFTRDEETVTGGWAELFFDPAGSVQRVRVHDGPIARGRLSLAPASGEEPQPVEVSLSGPGPMELTYSAESPLAEFRLPGPAVIEAREASFRLDAEELVEGEFWGRGLARLQLRGEVRGEFEGSSFEGRDVAVRGSNLEDPRRRVLLDTAAPSRFTGRTEAGEPYEARTQGALSLELVRDRARILSAREVASAFGEARSWTLEAALLRDLDPEARSFEAEGAVTYRTPEGTGEAERAVGRSAEHLELFGSEERPATFVLDAERARTLDLATLAARHLDVRPRRVVAEQAVELRLEDDRQQVEVDAGWFELRLPEGRRAGKPTPLEFTARELRRTRLAGGGGVTSFLAETIEGRGTLLERAGGATELDLADLRADGDARLEHEGEGGLFRARGARVRWTPGGAARLEADPRERVEARGRFQAGGLPYVLSANWIEYRADSIQALYPEITLDRPAALPGPLAGRAAVDLHAGAAEWLTADAAGVLLAGAARFTGVTRDGSEVELEAGSMHLLRSEDGPARSQGAEGLVAWDGFELAVAGRARGRGEVLELGYEVLRLEGRPAEVEFGGFVWESDNIVYDVPRVLITTDQGVLRGAPGTSTEGWTATYESLQPYESGDQTMMVMRSPLMRSGDRELRGAWATLWLDRDEWLEKTRLWLSEEEPPRPEVPPAPSEPEQEEGPSAPTLFGRFDASEASRVVKELYLEGGIEYSVAGERKALMDAFYLDLVLGHGWIQGAELFVDAKAGSLESRLAVRADWLRHSADGTLHADEAEVTSCGFAEPHYFVSTKNLRLTPVGEGSTVWDVLLEDNSVVFDNGLSVPLPRVHYKSDGKGRPTFGGLRAGNSARFGSFVEAQIDVDVSETVAETVAPLLGASPEEVDSSYGLRASYYGSRGLLLDQRFRATAGEHFWIDAYLDAIYDQGEDVGFLRYKEDDSGDLRWQLWTVGRYGLGRDQWLDLQYSKQSDLGFQAEFNETQFVRYERRDTFLRWRRADDSLYMSAIARIRSDEFRNEIERLPEAGVLRGVTPLAELGGQPLLYSASADAGYLRLRQGDEQPFSPFDPDLPAVGDREYLRADTRHRLEAPFETGVAGVRLAPYVALAGTAWSEGIEEEDAPARGAALAGVEARTTLFSTWRYGIVNTVMPFVGFRGDLATTETGDTPIRVDPRDAPFEGNITDVGIRSRWRVPGGARYLDLSVRASHAQDTAGGEPEGWLPTRVLGEYLAVYGGVPFSLTHDGLYDLDDGEVPLSVTSLSVLPLPDVGVELSYNRGLDENGDDLFDAVGFGARWDATRKWQLEGRQSISLLDSQALSSNLVVRRLGHDFVFELVYGFRSGEGGNSIAFRYRPLLGWRAPGFGNMQLLQRARL